VQACCDGRASAAEKRRAKIHFQVAKDPSKVS
jgi:hypothetical protein